jgi:hypothetical protein
MANGKIDVQGALNDVSKPLPYEDSIVMLQGRDSAPKYANWKHF